ncbi:hypothetical protein KW849_08595 [Pseudomonas sp. PDM26]|uniref:hypothetical protein n=1 Tax=Pseudomonas sp. PDM26 TaxID=2854766 RepID=UPI001C451478|nr:hypothetical protein [Pseudomonas sp. PDM26]MBV7546353.1 hypothetical protein [Pseudomonas sp. PDM26]
MTKITIKEIESLTVEDAGRLLREDGNLAGRISVRKDGVSGSFFSAPRSRKGAKFTGLIQTLSLALFCTAPF